MEHESEGDAPVPAGGAEEDVETAVSRPPLALTREQAQEDIRDADTNGQGSSAAETFHPRQPTEASSLMESGNAETDAVDHTTAGALATDDSNARASNTNAHVPNTNARVPNTNARVSDIIARASNSRARASHANARVSDISAQASNMSAPASDTGARASDTSAATPSLRMSSAQSSSASALDRSTRETVISQANAIASSVVQHNRNENDDSIGATPIVVVQDKGAGKGASTQEGDGNVIQVKPQDVDPSSSLGSSGSVA